MPEWFIWPYYLVPFIPIAIILDVFVHADATLIFVTAALGVIPTAALMGVATEELAAKSGPGLGGLLNVTFGNAPELIIALFLGWLPHNDLAYDSTALWMHIASGVRGLPDRIGRLVPVVLIALPLLAVAIPLAIAVHGRWAFAPALVGVCAALLLSGLGLSSVASVVAPYAVSRPGDSPFQQPQRTGSGGVLSQGLVMVGAMVAASPSIWFAWQAVASDTADAFAALWAGLGVGVVVFVVGVAAGAAASSF